MLDQIDVLSGTSGGSYALSWYYMQNQQGKKGKDLFDQIVKVPSAPDEIRESPAQNELRKHANFLTLPKYVGSGFANVVLLSPVNALLNGVLGTHTNTSFADWLYQKTIRDTFHSRIPTTLKEIRKAFLDQKQPDLPYFIITTTSRIDENTFHFDSLLRNTVFEFTPLRVGNDGFTYINSDSTNIGDLELARIVAIAGAAPDSSQVVSGSTQRFFASIFNADYGQYIYNYNDTRHEFRRLVTKLFPFPFYFFTESYSHDMRGSDIYLSDGGHQENLAVYPLIRRQCQNILIVDAEYDPTYEFESYFKVKHGIEREMRVNMTLQPTSFCLGRPDLANCKENKVDAIEPALRKASESGLTREEAENNLINVSQCCFSGQHPVMEGKIGHFPILDEGKQEVQWRETKLLYVKLAIDTNLFQGWETLSEKRKSDVKEKIGVKAAEYYAATRQDTCKIQYSWDRCAFPQYSTTHQSFTPTQFDAYVDLGATMIKNYVTTTDGQTLQLKPQAHTPQ